MSYIIGKTFKQFVYNDSIPAMYEWCTTKQDRKDLDHDCRVINLLCATYGGYENIPDVIICQELKSELLIMDLRTAIPLVAAGCDLPRLIPPNICKG